MVGAAQAGSGPASPVRIGMVGGGEGAFIGEVHRLAMRISGRYALVCGALSSDPDRARRSARNLFIAEDRAYVSYEEMIEKENKFSEKEEILNEEVIEKKNVTEEQ